MKTKHLLYTVASLLIATLIMACDDNDNTISDYAPGAEGIYACYMDAMHYDSEAAGWKTLASDLEELAVITATGQNRLSIKLDNISFPSPTADTDLELGTIEIGNLMVAYYNNRYELSGTASIDLTDAGLGSGTIYATASIDRSKNCTITLLLRLGSEESSIQNTFKLTFTTDTPAEPEEGEGEE